MSIDDMLKNIDNIPVFDPPATTFTARREAEKKYQVEFSAPPPQVPPPPPPRAESTVSASADASASVLSVVASEVDRELGLAVLEALDNSVPLLTQPELIPGALRLPAPSSELHPSSAAAAVGVVSQGDLVIGVDGKPIADVSEPPPVVIAPEPSSAVVAVESSPAAVPSAVVMEHEVAPPGTDGTDTVI